MVHVAAFLLPLAAALVLTPLAVRVAWATGFLDHPEARKLHTSATALLGGLVVFVCALAGWLAIHVVRHAPSDPQAIGLLLGAAVTLALGLWDDRFGMGVPLKLTGQAFAALVLLASGGVPSLGLPAPVEAGLAAIALVALMNAVNFLDNMNGMVA